MKVAGEYTFDASPEAVWKGLMDPEVLAATMPGCEKLELVGENQYEGELNIKVGPVQGKFKGKIELENIDEPNGYDLKLKGQGAQGFVKATANVSISSADNGKTLMKYDGDSQVGGRIASVGQRLLDSSAKAIIRQSLGGLNDVLSSSGAGAGADGANGAAGLEGEARAPVQVAAPSQAAFAANVAKEVAKDLVPTPVWFVLAALVILLIGYLILR